MLEGRPKNGFSMYHFLPPPPPYLTFSLYTQNGDKVHPAAKEVTVDLLVRRACGCFMLLRMEITYSDRAQGQSS